MYLSKQDYDFLVYLHDNFLADKIENRVQNIPETYLKLDEPINIACLMDETEYEYFITMLMRLKKQRDEYNEKQKNVMREKRIIHGKNYGRGYSVSIKKRDCR